VIYFIAGHRGSSKVFCFYNEELANPTMPQTTKIHSWIHLKRKQLTKDREPRRGEW